MKNKYGVKKDRSPAVLKKLPYENAAAALDGWTDGGRVVGLTKGQFSLIDMINVLLEKIGPAEVVISTWSAGLRDSLALNAMRESGRARSVLIILDRSYSTRQPEYAVTVEDAFGKENIRTTNNHAKFVLLRGERNTICIRSSMNLNKNDRCENFDLDDDPEIFDFYMDFVREIFEKTLFDGFVEKREKVDPVFRGLMKGNDTLTDDGATWGAPGGWGDDTKTAAW